MNLPKNKKLSTTDKSILKSYEKYRKDTLSKEVETIDQAMKDCIGKSIQIRAHAKTSFAPISIANKIKERWEKRGFFTTFYTKQNPIEGCPPTIFEWEIYCIAYVGYERSGVCDPNKNWKILLA